LIHIRPLRLSTIQYPSLVPGYPNGITFSCYDIDLTKYTKYVTLDGYNIRQFRFRSLLADADFQMYNAQQTRYDIFMSNKNGLSVYAFAVPFDNPFLDKTKLN
jgi:hypothetical protein